MEIKLELSPYGIKKLIDKLEFLEDQLNVANEDLVEQLVSKGTQYATSLNASAPQSGVEKSAVIGKVTEKGTKGYVALTGPNAVYDEFGTGEEGLKTYHPLKDVVSPKLNPYNSGPVVSTHVNKNGRHYWFYKPMANKPYFERNGYTEGTPSGKQMYRTAQYLRNEKDKMIKKILNDAIKGSK